MKKKRYFERAALIILVIFMIGAVELLNANQTAKEDEQVSQKTISAYNVDITTTTLPLLFEDETLSEDVKNIICDDINIFYSHVIKYEIKEKRYSSPKKEKKVMLQGKERTITHYLDLKGKYKRIYNEIPFNTRALIKSINGLIVYENEYCSVVGKELSDKYKEKIELLKKFPGAYEKLDEFIAKIKYPEKLPESEKEAQLLLNDILIVDESLKSNHSNFPNDPLLFAKELINNYSKPSRLLIEDGNVWTDKVSNILKDSLLTGLVVYENKNPFIKYAKIGEAFPLPMLVIYKSGKWKFFVFDPGV